MARLLARLVLVAVAIITIVLVARVVLPHFQPGPSDELADDGAPAANVTYAEGSGESPGAGIISVSGFISSATVKAVTLLLQQHPAKTLRIWSGGGFTPAAQVMARRLNAAGVRLEVVAGAICSSACVALLGDMRPELRRIDPAAWLRVHGNSSGPGDRHEADDVAAGLSPWVKKLSPAWFDFLAACPSRPLIRDAGIAMTWGEVQTVSSHPAAIDCSRIAFRTKTWLFGRR